MAKVSLADHMKEKRVAPAEEPAKCGPYITISRRFGCHGFSLGLLLMEILNDGADEEHTWKIYHREVLSRLATETNLATDILDQQRRAKPRWIVDFFRSLGKERLPSGHEVRNRITTIIRGLAIEGYALVIGQGSTWATQDLKNGLSIRLEGPYDWRVKQVAFREGLNETQAKLVIGEKEQERDYLRKLYEAKSKKTTPFDLTYDCSQFTLTQIAQHVAYALKLKGMLT